MRGQPTSKSLTLGRGGGTLSRCERARKRPSLLSHRMSPKSSKRLWVASVRPPRNSVVPFIHEFDVLAGECRRDWALFRAGVKDQAAPATRCASLRTERPRKIETKFAPTARRPTEAARQTTPALDGIATVRIYTSQFSI